MSDNQERVSELCPELIAMHSLNPFAAYNSPSRGTMFAGHFAQRLVIEGSEPSLIQTGVEEEFGKYTFSIKMPSDGTIVRIIDKYQRGLADEGIASNPESIVVYRDDETGQIDYFKIPTHLSHHPNFGFRYEQKEAMSRLTVGRDFPKDTVFADSPAVKGDSHYTYGKNLNVIYMSHPNVGLDGYVINEDALKYFKFKVYENRSISVGPNNIPINLYGDDDVYKAFPDIGDFVREDGLLMATRKFDPFLAPALLGKDDLRRVDYLCDEKIYVRAGVGRVIDITVTRSENVNRQLPGEMTQQLEKYARANERYHSDVVKLWDDLVKESFRNGNEGRVNISRKLQRLIVVSRAIANRNNQRNRSQLTLTYKREPLDNWLINFTIEYEVTPQRGDKLTCANGGKGVICRIEKPENMPVDADGNVADLISGPDSIPGRMNLGRLYAPYFNGAARDVRKQVLEELGFHRNHKEKITTEQLISIQRERPDVFVKAESTLLKFYSIVSPRTYREYTEVLTADQRLDWLLMVFNDASYLYMSIERDVADGKTELFPDEKVMEVEKNFKLVYGPVTYVGRSGRKVVTKNKFRIAPLYIMLLDKTPDSWLSADIGKHSNFGILAAMNKTDKFTTPWRKTTPRTVGETEGRLYCMYGGREMIAELMDRNGNLATQKEIAKTIISHDTPTNIQNIVDREKIPLGNTRPNQLIRHIFRCAGFDIKYKKEKR